LGGVSLVFHYHFFLQYCIFYPPPASPFCYNIADIFPVFYTTVSLCAK
jgi:hypothetical protein